jgi:hypothetical protein
MERRCPANTPVQEHFHPVLLGQEAAGGRAEAGARGSAGRWDTLKPAETETA